MDITYESKNKKLLLFIAFFIITLYFTSSSFTVFAGEQKIKILFTHDIHSNLSSRLNEAGELVGGAAKLYTAIKQEEKEYEAANTIYVDGGDFSQGTLYQTAFSGKAGELDILSRCNCIATTIGNHEWDATGMEFAKMLDSARSNIKEHSPVILCSNIDFSGELSGEQNRVKQAYTDYLTCFGYDTKDYIIYNTGNGIRVGIFGVSGDGSIENSPTSGQKWLDYIDTAKSIAAELKGKCDLVICLSHSGTSDESKGEDIDLAKAVKDIDVIVSGHSHSTFDKPVIVNNTIICSSGSDLSNLGSLELSINEGKIDIIDYNIIPLDKNISEDKGISEFISGLKRDIEGDYLLTYGNGRGFDDIIAYSNFDFIPLEEMYLSTGEFNMGNIIADSYMYAAGENGINDIDAAIVCLGTIRDSIKTGNVTVEEAFNICSLGVGKDNSPGHPLTAAYLKGKDLKLLCEMALTFGSLVPEIKMSYSGLSITYDTNRILFDRITDISIVGEKGKTKVIDDNYYKICVNMYAANMMGMIKSLSKGLFSLNPVDENGIAVTDYYSCSLKDSNGQEIKEWVAFADFLGSFDKNKDGVSVIPDDYKYTGDRICYTKGSLLSVFKNPGTSTIICIVIFAVFIGIVFLVYRKYKKA